MPLPANPSGWFYNVTLCKLMGICVGVCHSSMKFTEELKRETQVKGSWGVKDKREEELSW